MGYIRNWTDFETAAIELYAKSPNKVRYCVKFKPKTGHLVLRLTDDTTCIMYKTFSAIILNRFEALNNRLLSQISNTKSRTRLLAPGPTARDRGASVSPGAEEDDPMSGTGLGTPARVGTPAPPTNAPNAQTPNQGAKGGGGAGGAGGAGKKKKKGKK